VQVIGHRGVVDPAGPPENTLAAVERALADGADGVEVDVRVTRDGAVVCVHDPDLLRVAGIAVEVDRAAYSSMHDIRLRGRHPIPTVSSVVRRVASRALLVLDLKPVGRRTPALVAGVVAAVRDHGDPARICVSSLDVGVLDAVGRCLPAVRRALITPDQTPLHAAAAMAPGLDLHAHVRSLLADAGSAQRLAAEGRTIRCWTVNRVVDAQLLDVLGVEAVITDDPAAMRAGLSSASLVT
jgi:glycerophosphoryl diester phosphodiesterase